MKGKNYEHTESRETFIKAGFISIFADTTNEYCLFRFASFFHKLKLSETESRREDDDQFRSHKIGHRFVHNLHSDTSTTTIEEEKDHRTETDTGKVCTYTTTLTDR
jgi:hypothetical protein